MALTSTSKQISSLKINKVPSAAIYAKMVAQNLINDDELYLISGEADTITGVKGNKETTYRTGNINLTPADIGALPDTTEIPVVPTNIGAFENDAGYLTQHQSLTDYPKKTELANVATSGDYTDLINTPTIPSTKGLATETYVQNKIAEVVNSAPGTLDTLNELAKALGNDPNFATTMATELGKKANTANLATVATSGSYNDLSNKPTIPSVGNGTLTIQKNGTSAGTFTANATTDKTINIIVPTKVSELTDDVVKGKYLPLTGGTMTGKLTVPQVETGDGNSNFFQCRKFRGEGNADTYYHAIDFGYKNHDQVDFHEYGGKWNFYKNQSGKVNEGVLCGSITSNGWEGRAKLKSGSTMVTSQLTENSDAIATTAFVHGLVDNVKHYSASNPPPYPVTSVNGKTGAVQLTTADIDLDSSIMFLNKTNTMTANGKITMDSSYTPGADGDIATKKYVDNSTPATFTASKAGTVPASGGGTTKYLRADGTWTTIDKTPVIGTNTNCAIYIGTTAPASGTTPLLWIDTTSSTGFLKYRSSNTSAWTAVPVAWTE